MYDPRAHDRIGHRYLPEKFIQDVTVSSQDGEKVVMFRPENHRESMMEEGSDDSGVCSPPLWKNHPSPPKSPSEPLLADHSRRSLSPNSRTQAIVRGQWELMEMVKNMPESSYELTLRDLVENPASPVDQTGTTSPEYSVISPMNMQQRGEAKVKKQGSGKKHEKNVMRTGSLENKGLFLNMVFPFSFKSKKKKGFASTNTGRVSPKPEVVKGVAEKDWWKKRFTGSSDSDSSRTSNNSGSGGSSGSSGSSGGRSTGSSRIRKGFLCGCLPCLFNSKREKNT